jgi:hypothetical protein
MMMNFENQFLQIFGNVNHENPQSTLLSAQIRTGSLPHTVLNDQQPLHLIMKFLHFFIDQFGS